MKHSVITRITIFISLFLVGSLDAQDINVKWLGDVPTQKTAVSWGVPFEKSKINAIQQFILFDNKNNETVLQSWPLAYWPNGSVKWMGFAAAVNPAKQYLLRTVKTISKESFVAIENKGFIQINNGVFTCKINKSSHVLFDNISFGSKVVAENGRLICSLENREKINERILSFDDYETQISDVQLEQTGSVKAVVKITGIYKSTKSGRTIFPFTVRMSFYAGVQDIRVIHSFVYNGNQDTDFIKALGVVFDVPLREQDHNRYVRFSGDNEGLWSESVKALSGRYPFVYNGDNTLPEKQFNGDKLPNIDNSDPRAFDFYKNFPSWNDYKLSQLNSNGFSISKRTNNQSSWLHADDGQRASGLAMIGDVSGGMAVSLKDFWQSYPAALEVNNARSNKAQLKVWFWSPDAEAMDLRHYDTIAHDLLATYEDVQEGLSTPYGVARTSELTLFPFAELPTKIQTLQMAHRGESPYQLVCTPEYLHAVKAFGSWSLPDSSNETKKWIENRLDSSILYYKQSIDERHWYGFWNYGDVMHTYDPNRHIWKYDIGGFAWDNTELAPNNWLWYSFLRTGRADIFKMAEAMTRHTSEVDAYHLGEMKGLGSRHNVSHWGCGSKEARIGQAAWKRFYYYLTTDERSGDLMREALDVEKALVKYEPLRIAQPREKFPYTGPMRLRWGPDWLALAGNWMTEWERTGDIRYRNKIMAGLESLAKLPDNLFTGPNGLSFDPESAKLWYDGPDGITNQNHLATIMGGYEILTELFDLVDCKDFRKVFTEYGKYYSMDVNSQERTSYTKNWGDVNFRTPRLTAFAAKELNDEKLAERAWDEFFGAWNKGSRRMKELPSKYGVSIISSPDVLNPVHENVNVGTNGAAQWALNAIFMLEMIGDKIPDSKAIATKNAFNKLKESSWKEVFMDDFKQSWQEKWFLDGEKAKLKNSKSTLLFKAGVVAANDANHSVLWTKQSFEGDLRIEFDFTKKDTATRFVNILYVLAEGSGIGPFEKDIMKWSELRKVPAMNLYFEHMNALHISFAAYENDNNLPSEDYIRARRYMPERNKGLSGTDLKPDYYRTTMFKTNQKNHISIIKKGHDVFMEITNADKSKLCHWKLDDFPALYSGRIGLRLMGSRVSEFVDFKVYQFQ